MTAEASPRCPVDHNARKTGFGQDHLTPGIEQQGNIWYLRSYAAVRQVLRDGQHVRQGASTDNFMLKWLRPSVVFQDGGPHREQRTAIAGFFTPKTVQEKHHAFIDHLTERLMVRLMRAGKADLSVLSMELAVEVAARVVGLTDSLRPGMDRRIDALLSESDIATDAPDDLAARVRRLGQQSRDLLRMSAFYRMDVRPAIVARRKTPQQDVISHLIGKGYNDLEILVECLTYAAAGMVTTREFISVAAWHLLEREDLRRTYLSGDRNERHLLLHELLRLEPVASTLLRRTEGDVSLDHAGTIHHVPAGARIILDIRTANADGAAVGEEPLSVCPFRPLARGVQAPVLSFGDGEHRCPGAFLAIHESDVFLHRLLALPVRLEGTPQLIYNKVLMSYEIRDFQVELDRSTEGAPLD